MFARTLSHTRSLALTHTHAQRCGKGWMLAWRYGLGRDTGSEIEYQLILSLVISVAKP